MFIPRGLRPGASLHSGMDATSVLGKNRGNENYAAVRENETIQYAHAIQTGVFIQIS